MPKKKVSLNSALGWVYISNEERKKTADLLDALISGSRTVDEIGISPIRDWFSDQLFPGFSTAQRRVKYFIQVPKLLQELVAKKIPRTRKQVETELHEKEWRFIGTFKDDPKSLDKKGIIGVNNYKKNVKRLSRYPSELYWSGLVTTGIITSDQTTLNGILTKIAQRDGYPSQDKDEDDGQSVASFLNIDVDLLNLKWDTSCIELNHSEATYLHNIFVNGEKTKNSLTPIFLKKGAPKDLKAFYSLEKEYFGDNKRLYEIWRKAVKFGEFIHGAHLMYNHLLTKNDDFLDEYKKWFDKWFNKSARYDITELNDLPKNTKNAVDFVQQFIDCNNADKKNSSYEKVKKCITMREHKMKRENAKINRGITCSEGAYKKDELLHYRFNVAKRACDDIVKGLKKHG